MEDIIRRRTLKKILKLLIIIIIAVLIFFGYTKLKGGYNSVNWEEKIRKEILSGTSDIEREIAKVVSIEVKVQADHLTVTVSAPDICDDLITWIDQVSEEDFSTEILEKEMLKLLRCKKPNKSSFELNYTFEEAQIDYSQEFLEAVTCGITRFSGELTNRILESLED